MALHETLRELVEVRGTGVTEDAEEFRGALDDFLSEADATTGELNLLVDAVRLGGLRRLVDVLDHGAEVDAAVHEAATGLARDRGSDDVRRAGWAVATLGFALGRVPAATIRAYGAGSSRSTILPPAADQPPPPAPGRPSAPGGRPGDSLSATEAMPSSDPSAGHTTAYPGQPRQPARPEPRPAAQPTAPAFPPAPPAPPAGSPTAPVRSRRRTPVLIAIAVVIGLVAGIGVALWMGRDSDRDPGSARDGSTTDGDPDDGSSVEASEEAREAIPQESILVPFEDDRGMSRIYLVDSAGGPPVQLTDGPYDRLPSVSPDRGTVIHLVGDERPYSPVILDVGAGATRPLFDTEGPCGFSVRPGWSPSGDRLGIICTGEDDVPDGLYVSSGDGSEEPEQVLSGADLRGAPTWLSEDRFVFGRENADDELSLWVETLDDDRDPVQLPAPEGMQLSHADWNPQKNRLMVLVTPLGAGAEVGSLYSFDADLAVAEPLHEGAYAHPVVSADGEQVAVVVDDQLSVLSWESGDLAPVANVPGGLMGIPAWGSR